MVNTLVTVWLPALILLAALGVWAYGVIDFSLTEDEDLRLFSRPAWLLILVLGSFVGALLWLTLGRAQHSSWPSS